MSVRSRCALMVQGGLFSVAMQKGRDIRRVRLPLRNIKRCRFNRLFI
jgi:hypothetical protein